MQAGAGIPLTRTVASAVVVVLFEGVEEGFVVFDGVETVVVVEGKDEVVAVGAVLTGILYLILTYNCGGVSIVVDAAALEFSVDGLLLVVVVKGMEAPLDDKGRIEGFVQSLELPGFIGCAVGIV